MNYIKNIGKKSCKAFENLKSVKHSSIQKTLSDYSQLIKKNQKNIINENLKDLNNSKRRNLIDRLLLNKKRINQIRDSLQIIKKFENPVGKILSKWKKSNNLWIEKISIPIGVIAVIYEIKI